MHGKRFASEVDQLIRTRAAVVGSKGTIILVGTVDLTVAAYQLTNCKILCRHHNEEKGGI